MTLTPNFQTINGRGKPIIIHEASEGQYSSLGGLTWSATSVTEAMGATVGISSSSAATNLITTGAPHGFSAGQRIRIAGHTGSTPDLNGDWECLAPSGTDFSIGVDITVGGTGGTVRRIPDFRNVRIGMRGTATKTVGSYARPCWGKVTAIDAVNFIIYVDKWRQGTTEVTPDAGSFTVNGWIILMPYCFELTEIFEPDVLIHPLQRTTNLPSRIKTRFYGWRYTCILNYAKWISADTLIALRPALNMKENDNLVLIPREDKPHHQYNVYHADAIELARYGISPGHRKPIFVLKGKETIPSWPIPESGYGFGYATHYGTQL